MISIFFKQLLNSSNDMKDKIYRKAVFIKDFNISVINLDIYYF